MTLKTIRPPHLSHTLDVPRTTSTAALKQLVAEKFGLNGAKGIKILMAGKVLNDAVTLTSISGTSVTMNVMLPPNVEGAAAASTSTETASRRQSIPESTIPDSSSVNKTNVEEEFWREVKSLLIGNSALVKTMESKVDSVGPDDVLLAMKWGLENYWKR